MSIISNMLDFFYRSSKAEVEIQVNSRNLSSESPLDQLSIKIISHLQLHSSSRVILIFSSRQAGIIRRILDVLRSYQDRIHVVIGGERIDIPSGLAQRTAYSVNTNDMIVRIQKQTLQLKSEHAPAPTELYDSIFIGCNESNNFLAGRRANTIQHTHQVVPSVHSLRIYEHRSSESAFP